MKPDENIIYELHLFIFSRQGKSETAVKNLQDICYTHLGESFRLEITDLSTHPEMASKNQILATPTLIKKRPFPERRIIGDLSNGEKVLASLGIKAVL